MTFLLVFWFLATWCQDYNHFHVFISRQEDILRGKWFSRGKGHSVQKTLVLQGCAANMGSKISLLVYEWPLIKWKIWYMNGSIFKNFPKFEPKILSGKNPKIGQKLSRLLYEWVTFSWKISIWMGLLSNSAAAHRYQNQTWVSPPPRWFCFEMSSYVFGVNALSKMVLKTGFFLFCLVLVFFLSVCLLAFGQKAKNFM